MSSKKKQADNLAFVTGALKRPGDPLTGPSARRRATATNVTLPTPTPAPIPSGRNPTRTMSDPGPNRDHVANARSEALGEAGMLTDPWPASGSRSPLE